MDDKPTQADREALAKFYPFNNVKEETLRGDYDICEEMETLIEHRLAAGEPVANFQERVQPWMMACFGPEISADKLERSDRFIEEALELVQAGNYPKERALALVDYVYGRPQGEINQEVGGVMVTLAAHCLAHGVDMHEAGEIELARIWTKVEQIRAKQAAKPTGSALPIARPIAEAGDGETAEEHNRRRHPDLMARLDRLATPSQPPVDQEDYDDEISVEQMAAIRELAGVPQNPVPLYSPPADLVERARSAVEEIANTRMDMTLERWGELSSTILAALSRPTLGKEEIALLIRKHLWEAQDNGVGAEQFADGTADAILALGEG